MFGLRKFEPHFDLMHKMADTVDVSLEKVLEAGDSGAQRLRSAMVRCAFCDDVNGCQKFLEDNKDGAPEPMATCPNKNFLMGLKD